MMDYKYIEQLLESYFNGATTLEEEAILRQFFAQDDVPEHLRLWQTLFRSEKALSEACLDEEFDERLLALTGEYHVKARQIPWHVRLRPLMRAAALIAFAVVVGTAVERSTGSVQEPSTQQVAVEEQDELDVNEAKPLDIRSAELLDTVSVN